jgi:methylase of polypeptide subunit release factors
VVLVKTQLIEKLSEEVKKEPKIALDVGKYGINVIKEIFNWEKNINKNKASIILIEIDESIIKNVTDPEKMAEFIEKQEKNLKKMKKLKSKSFLLMNTIK